MEPITTTAILTLVSYLSNKAFDKVFDTAAGEFTKESIKWLKSVFYKEDGKPKEVLEDLQKNPEDELNQNDAVTAIQKGLRNNPKAEQWLKEILNVLEKKIAQGEQITTTISNSKNIVVNSKFSTGSGDFIIGDNHVK